MATRPSDELSYKLRSQAPASELCHERNAPRNEDIRAELDDQQVECPSHSRTSLTDL